MKKEKYKIDKTFSRLKDATEYWDSLEVEKQNIHISPYFSIICHCYMKDGKKKYGDIDRVELVFTISNEKEKKNIDKLIDFFDNNTENKIEEVKGAIFKE